MVFVLQLVQVVVFVLQLVQVVVWCGVCTTASTSSSVVFILQSVLVVVWCLYYSLCD